METAGGTVASDTGDNSRRADAPAAAPVEDKPKKTWGKPSSDAPTAPVAGATPVTWPTLGDAKDPNKKTPETFVTSSTTLGNQSAGTDDAIGDGDGKKPGGEGAKKSKKKKTPGGVDKGIAGDERVDASGDGKKREGGVAGRASRGGRGVEDGAAGAGRGGRGGRGGHRARDRTTTEAKGDKLIKPLSKWYGWWA